MRNIAQIIVASPLAAWALACGAVPPGAAELGYTKQVVSVLPRVADVSADGAGSYKFYSGAWWMKYAPTKMNIADSPDGIAIGAGTDLVTVARDLKRGTLPVLPGKDGFYVEFESRISDNDKRRWPALWLMPVEHGPSMKDRHEGDPENYQRWMELDVDEGWERGGMMGTVHSWSGVWPHYKTQINKNHLAERPLDRTKVHTFGASYDPIQHRVTWWLDGVRQMSAEAPEVGAKQNFYIIMSAQNRGGAGPYTMYVKAIRVFVPPSTALPVSN